MVAFSSMAESKFLKKEDLDPVQGNLVTIKGFTRAKVSDDGEEPEYKFTVAFREFEKPMVLNATNRAILEKAFGPDTEDCVGKQVVAYIDENISFQGKLVGGIRLRQRRVAATTARPVAPPPIAQGVDDLDIPF